MDFLKATSSKSQSCRGAAQLGWGGGGVFSLKSQLPALDGEMVTDSNYLWSHQLVALFPQAGRFYMSGVGVAGSWEG